MADDATSDANAQKEEGKQEEGAKPIVDADVAKLREENVRLAEQLNARTKEAEGAQAYVTQMMNSLNRAAESVRGNGAEGDARPTLREALEENPEQVLDDHFRSRIAPLANAYASNQAAINRQAFADRMTRDDMLSEEYKKYEAEVDKFMEAVPADVRAQPGAYDRAFKFVLAEHVEDVIKARSQRAITRTEKAAFVEAGGGAASRERKPEGLSDVEKQVARGLGMTEAEYVEWGKKDQYGS